MAKTYDAEDPLPAEEWLLLEEGERIQLVIEGHQRVNAKMGQNETAHATIHVIVETQLAEKYAPAVRAFDRFRAAGVNRHNTVHALASVVTRHMIVMMERHEPFDEAEAARDYDALDPADFMRKRDAGT